jgi:hypothetical protein
MNADNGAWGYCASMKVFDVPISLSLSITLELTHACAQIFEQIIWVQGHMFLQHQELCACIIAVHFVTLSKS